jgi:hypothetical protein
MYEITPYTRKMAKSLGVEIEPSTRKNKKLRVIYNGQVYHIGDSRYSDYGQYLLTHGKYFADLRREAYYKRHANDQGILGNLAMYLLW